MKTLVIIQARTGSSRLPRKILMPLAGKPLLQRMVERVRAGGDYDILVATTTDPGDDTVADLCRALQINCFRGHPTDLLDRHYTAAVGERADVIVKIPSDCPLIDPGVIGKVLGYYHENRKRYDFVSNLHPATFPDGNDVEVVPMPVLTTAWREATRPFEREHTTPFIWERPERFRIGNVTWEAGLNYSMTHRWTIDYPEDYQFISSVYDALWKETGPIFGMKEILDLLDRRPELARINARYAGVNWYRDHLGELKTIGTHETRMPAGQNQ